MRGQRDKQVIIQVFPHGGWKIAAGGGVLLLVGFLAVIYRVEFGLILMGSGGLGMAWGLWRLYDNIRTSNTRHRMLETEVAALTLRAGVIVEDTKHAGAFVITTNIDIPGNVKVDHIAPTRPERESLLLDPGEAEAPPQKPDLLRVLTQPGTVYVLTGAQRSGKSWQAGHVCDYWLSLGIVPAVFGTKTDNPGYDWSGCDCLITDDRDQMDKALQSIMAQCAERHKLLKAQRLPQPIILDDWMATLALTEKTAYQFMLLAATKLASSGIIAYFIMQSDTAAAFGLKELGAMLKNNFMQLSVIPIPAPTGEIVPGQSKAELIYPNAKAKDAVTVDLIPGRPGCFPDPVDLAGSIVEGAAAEVKRSPEEIIRAELKKDSNIGQNKLLIAAFGSKGGRNLEARKNIVADIKAQMGIK